MAKAWTTKATLDEKEMRGHELAHSQGTREDTDVWTMTPKKCGVRTMTPKECGEGTTLQVVREISPYRRSTTQDVNLRHQPTTVDVNHHLVDHHHHQRLLAGTHDHLDHRQATQETGVDHHLDHPQDRRQGPQEDLPPNRQSLIQTGPPNTSHWMDSRGGLEEDRRQPFPNEVGPQSPLQRCLGTTSTSCDTPGLIGLRALEQ